MDTKQKIESIVKEYETNFSAEFEMFKQSIRKKRDAQLSATGDMTKTTDIVQRPIVETPATLWGLIQMRLDDGEFKWLLTHKGIRWFAKRFSQYKIIEKI